MLMACDPTSTSPGMSLSMHIGIASMMRNLGFCGTHPQKTFQRPRSTPKVLERSPENAPRQLAEGPSTFVSNANCPKLFCFIWGPSSRHVYLEVQGSLPN